MEDTYQVIVVGAGFAGVEAAKKLGRKGVRVLLIDSNNYHQFQPLLYQLATSQIGVSAITRPLRSVFRRYKTVKILTAGVASIDAAQRSVTTADGVTLRAEILVIAVGAVPNFFNTNSNQAQNRWQSAGFTTQVLFQNQGNYKIKYQSINGATVDPQPAGCASIITVGP